MLLLVAAALLALDSGRVVTQSPGPQCSPSEMREIIDRGTASRVPFSVGERLQYSVSFGHLHVGSAEMRIVGRDTVRGHATWVAQLAVSGGFSKLSVHDTTISHFDSSTFNSYRFTEHIHDPHYHADRVTQIYQDRRIWQKNDEAEQPSVADALDEVSFVYFVRTLALEPGQCFEFSRYFKQDGNPVVVHVVGRERITVPAGTFTALVLRPEIRTSGMFSQNGHAELWLSDDAAHLVLQLKTRMSVGSINLYLSSVTPSP